MSTPGSRGLTTVSGETGGARYGPAVSILFVEPEDAPDGGQERDPAYFRDLNLDQVVTAATRGREAYDLGPFFSTILPTLDAIAYRQEVFRDLENEPLRAAVAAFGEGLQAVRRYLAVADQVRHRYEREAWFLRAAHTYGDAVTHLEERLRSQALGSRAFVGIRDYFAGYVTSDAFTRLVADSRRVTERLAEVRYLLHISGDRITVAPYEGEPDYSREVTATFERFQQGPVDDHLATFSDAGGLDHVEAGVLERVARLHPDEFTALEEHHRRHAGFVDETVAAFDREVQFYLAYLDFITPLRRSGLPICLPEVSEPSREVRARDTVDIALAHKLVTDGKPVVLNDLAVTDPERVLVVSGANQGGKTTLARAFGQLHHLAGIGCPVPGSEARLFRCDGLFTHFAREESLADLRGQLQDDLVRMREILDAATARSVLIVNELFDSTTLADARVLGTHVLEQISALGALCVYVTFIDELSSLNERTVSMVATVDPEDPAVRTFKVVRQPAEGLAYAQAIADKHRLTYEQLQKRIGP